MMTLSPNFSGVTRTVYNGDRIDRTHPQQQTRMSFAWFQHIRGELGIPAGDSFTDPTGSQESRTYEDSFFKSRFIVLTNDDQGNDASQYHQKLRTIHQEVLDQHGVSEKDFQNFHSPLLWVQDYDSDPDVIRAAADEIQQRNQALREDIVKSAERSDKMQQRTIDLEDDPATLTEELSISPWRVHGGYTPPEPKTAALDD